MIKQIVKNNIISDLSCVGIYSIHHQNRPERLYIGSTGNDRDQKISHRGFYRRFYDHLRLLKLGKHKSKYLQNTVNKHGVDGIVFTILEICSSNSVNEIRLKELDYIDKLKPVYNTITREHGQARPWSAAERERQSNKMKGIPLPDSVYEKVRIPVKQYTTKGKFIRRYPSMNAAAKDTGIDRASINKVILKERISAGGFIWK